MSEEFKQLLEEHLSSDNLPQRGSIINVEVLQVNSDFVIVNVGAKSESSLPKKEFAEPPQVGSFINVYVESSSPSHVKLSLSKAKKQENVPLIKEAFENNTPLSGTIKKMLPKGFIVNLMDWEAFAPLSQISLEPLDSLSEQQKKQFLGQTLDFHILKYEENSHQSNLNLIIGRKSLLNKEKNKHVQEKLKELSLGDILSGKVVHIKEKSILVEIAPNVLGLVRIGDISWDRIKTPEDKVKVGDTVSVKVMEINEEKSQMLLSMKDVDGNIWEKFAEEHPVQSTIKAKVESIKPSFMILSAQEGIRGFLHKNDLSWTFSSASLTEEFKVGDSLETQILDIDIYKKKLSLGVKQLTENPFNAFKDQFNVGDKVTGTILRINDFAIFLELDHHVQAMLHRKDLSWNLKEQNLNHYKVGDSLECFISQIDLESQKVACSLKGDNSNPWGEFAKTHSIGSIIKGTIKEETSKGLVISFNKDIEAFMPFGQMGKNIDLSVGQEIDVLLTEFNAHKNWMRISHRALKEKETNEILQNYMTESTDTNSYEPTLGDFFPAKFKKKK